MVERYRAAKPQLDTVKGRTKVLRELGKVAENRVRLTYTRSNNETKRITNETPSPRKRKAKRTWQPTVGSFSQLLLPDTLLRREV